MPRRLTFLAVALVALLTLALPSIAVAKKASAPKVTSYSPTKPELGGKLTLFGKGFAKQRKRNTVILQAPNGATTFLKPIKASRTKLTVKLRSSISRLMRKKAGASVATRFRVRVLAGKRFGPWTKKKRSPVIRPKGDGDDGGASSDDCDGDGRPNGADDDDDNDLLSDTLEGEIKTDACLLDTDGDGAEDGFEYESALNLNNDEDQEPNTSLPYPGKRPYPNPLDPSDIGKDFDGDSLLLVEEHTLWTYSIDKGYAVRTLKPLYYSDGEQYSINSHVEGDRRVPALPAAGYEKQINFLSWATDNGYRTVSLLDGSPWQAPPVRRLYGLLDMNRDGLETEAVQSPFYRYSEVYYYDDDNDGYLDDGERDEDADGLTNVDEAHRRVFPKYWETCYAHEQPFHLGYAGPDVTDPDSDGDGIRDGADDQDHDDVPNVMELSRNAASGLWDGKDQRECRLADDLGGSNFEVIGGPLPNASVIVGFRNELGRLDVPQMGASGLFTGGGAISVSTITNGSTTTNEAQAITITGAPTGGSFTLTLLGRTTPALAFNSEASAVQQALENLFPAEDNSNHPNAYGRVNPFNPCMPLRSSRTCPEFFDGNTGAPFDDSVNWAALN